MAGNVLKAYLDPTEEELTEICLENYAPYELDPFGTERKARLVAAYKVDAEKLKKARDAAEAKYQKAMLKLSTAKHEKLEEVTTLSQGMFLKLRHIITLLLAT